MSDMDGAMPEEHSPAEPAQAEQAPGMAWSIDFGSFKCCVAASAEDRQAKIVLDDEFSRAEVPSFVSYQNEPLRRFVGESAAGRVAAHFASTFVELPALFEEGEEAGYPKCRHSLDGARFTVAFDGEKALSAAQITAALFAKLKAQLAAKHPVGACAITVPAGFSPAQRKQVLEAAAIAELEVSRLVSADVAAVSSYCSRHPEAEGVVLIVDIGHRTCTASISEHTEGKAKILAAESMRVGASCVDHALYQHVAKKCKDDHSVEVSLDSKIGQRVLKQCQNTKKVLSTIPQTVVHVELDERDLSFNVSRAEMEALCAEQLKPLGTLLEGLFSKLQDGQTVQSVEMLGGGSCIPMFQEAVLAAAKQYGVVDTTLRKTLDLSTACVVGAVLCSLGSSPLEELAPWDAGLEATQGSSAEAIAALVQAEQQVQRTEAEFAEYEAARNKFESMIYEVRALSEGKYKEQLPGTQVYPMMDREEEWLWGDGEAASLQQLQERLQAVQSEMEAAFPAYYAKLAEEAEEEKQAQEKQALEFAAHQAAEQAELEASGVVRDTRKLPFEERMKLVLKNKEEGTELFKGGNWEPAAVRYTKALNHAELIKEPSEEELVTLKQTKLSLYLNLGMCFSKMKKWPKAIDNCRYALEIDPKNSKAFFRRATAYYEEKDFDKAFADLEQAVLIEPVDAAVTKLHKIVTKAIAKRDAKEKATYGKMFG